uniref:Uncharacterized protein n=1 Tax=Myotis myotis TaxID=51298 RepID=A0A7J7SCR5_MYOMY|nr:hypothetical protein mMyoMyo1_009496 [Myotis myotis]
MAAEGGRKGCFVFPSHSCSHRSRSSQGGKSGPRGAACQVQPHKGALAKTRGPPWRGPTRGWEAALSPVGSCLWPSISPRTASCRSGSLEGGWWLASLVFPLLPVTSSLLSRAWQSRGEGPWEEQTQDALSEAQRGAGSPSGHTGRFGRRALSPSCKLGSLRLRAGSFRWSPRREVPAPAGAVSQAGAPQACHSQCSPALLLAALGAESVFPPWKTGRLKCSLLCF